MSAASTMPVVRVYPLCSECRAPYVLRHGFNLSKGGKETWIWQRDCKHKNAAPVVSKAVRS